MNSLYFETQSEALEQAFTDAHNRGYKVDFPESFNNFDHVAYGTTVRYWLNLYKDEKLQSKRLHIILYRMDSGRYELTHYIQ